MNEQLIKELCIYLGELDYMIENSKDYLNNNLLEQQRKQVHSLLNLPYKEKYIKFNYITAFKTKREVN